MEWKLMDGDYVPDGMGGLTALSGGEEVLARVLYRLPPGGGPSPSCPIWAAGCISCAVKSPPPGRRWRPNMWPRPWGRSPG